MKLNELLMGTDIVEASADTSIEVSGVCYDTRLIRKGELFIAIKGYETDGHKYIEQAVKEGAVCVICEEVPAVKTPYIIVKDSRKALAKISELWFKKPAEKLTLIGVTGTNGKTSVTNLIKFILENISPSKVGLIGTNGNFIGDRDLPAVRTTPESYEMQKLLDKMVLEGCKYVVMEVSSHALYLSRVFGINYEVGVYTNLSPEHLDFHGSMDEYANAKALLFASSKASVINADDSYAQTMKDSAAGSILTYGVNIPQADMKAENISLKADNVEFELHHSDEIYNVKLPIPGTFSVYNALAAISALYSLGYKINETAPILEKYTGVKGRAEVVQTGREFTVLIDYAHTPDALINIITAVRGFAKGRVITLFGCGGNRDKAKRPVMGKIATEMSDFTIITTDNPRTEEPLEIIKQIVAGITDKEASFEIIENRREAICKALDILNNDDVLILAGKGHETYQELGKEKIYFDDREVVAEHIKKKRVDSRKLPVEDLD